VHKEKQNINNYQINGKKCLNISNNERNSNCADSVYSTTVK
jgi:hypothetical protein